MSYDFALLALGIPVIIWLTVRAAQRVRAIKERIAQVQDDMARQPQNPYIALGELFNPPPPPSAPQESARGKIHD